MSRDGNDDSFSLRGVGEQQMNLAAQLGQSIVTMHHIDEVFQWLAYAIVQHFNIQLIQFWTNQIGQTGRLVTQLRTVVRRDPTIPEQVVVNDYVAYVAQRVTSERRSYQPQPIENIFPSYQSTLFKRYGLNYCGASFLSKNMLLPPPENMFASERSPVPLAMTTLFIIRRLLHPDVIPNMNMLLEQAMLMAGNRNLLLVNAPRSGHEYPAYAPRTEQNYSPYDYSPYAPRTEQEPFPYAPRTEQDFTPRTGPEISRSGQDFTPRTGQEIPRSGQDFMSPPSFMQSPPPPPARQEKVFTLEQLVPRRKQDDDMLLSENPFASGAIIADKKARRLHVAIDGRSNVANLCAVTGMSSKDVYTALQYLVGHKRIELYTPDGEPASLPPLTK